ncbi:hypothetical protein Nepgr_002038 [Nepenthes gracilis]|uniref:Uncharacterized protein n=1 Tax=Nepenthes gracilis TaxID=150966 RepID=A0AAD3RXI3_NEPGR|nr:hypothetical protein Nepgr_002038 [Nepenthes gracilis]
MGSRPSGAVLPLPSARRLSPRSPSFTGAAGPPSGRDGWLASSRVASRRLSLEVEAEPLEGQPTVRRFLFAHTAEDLLPGV